MKKNNLCFILAIMSMNVKTPEEHLYYLEEIVKLSLWISARYCNENPNANIVNILDEKTPIFNHTKFNKFHMFETKKPKPKEWTYIKNRLKGLYDKDNNPEIFEKFGFDLLKGHIKGRVKEDLKDLHYEGIDNQDESWLRYDIEEGVKRLELHFENSLYPNSFLSDKKNFYLKLNECLLDAKKNNIETLYSGSWLNSYDKFLDLFPIEWKESRNNVNYNIEFHLGFWGQFLRSNESLNEKTVSYLRENGIVKYPEADCEISVIELEKFLLGKSE